MFSVLVRLFAAFVKVGALAFGGGYSVLPLIREAALSNGWLTAEQFADVVAFAEVTPGPVTLNAASYAGFSAAGLPGAVAATLGCVLPSVPAVALLVFLYRKYGSHPMFGGVFGGLRPAVCALVFSAFLTLFLSSVFSAGSLADVFAGRASFSTAGFLIFAGAFALARAKTVPPAVLILFCGLCGAVLHAA